MPIHRHVYQRVSGLENGRDLGPVVGRSEGPAGGYGWLSMQCHPARHVLKDAELAARQKCLPQRRGSGSRDGADVGLRCSDPGRRRPRAPRPRCSPQLGQGRGADAAGRGERSVQPRLRTRDEGWAAGAKGRQLRQPGHHACLVGGGRAGLPSHLALCRRDLGREHHAGGSWRGGYSVGLSFMR